MLTTAALQLTSQNLWSAALNVWHLTPPSSYLLASSDLSQRDRTQVLALAMASCLFRLGAARADRLLRERLLREYLEVEMGESRDLLFDKHLFILGSL